MASTSKKVRMCSTESTYYYTTTKTKNCAEKLELRGYDPIVRKHVKFVEKKIK